MAVRAVTAGGTAAAGTTTNFLSDEVKTRARILAIVVSWSGAAADDTFSVFTTRSPQPVSEPQPGDPPVVSALKMRPIVTGGAVMAIPVQLARLVEPPFRIALSYTNTDNTNDRTVQVTMWYDDQPL